MALFRKDKQVTTTIPELQEYYATQKTESAGKAWLLAIGSLLVTIVILVGAFFGGRWVYRKITKNDKPSVATSQNTSAGTKASEDSKPSTSSTTSTTPSTPDTSTSTSSTAQGVATTQSAATNSSATAASTVTQLADTGPGNTISLFIAVMAISYVAHRGYIVRKLSK